MVKSKQLCALTSGLKIGFSNIFKFLDGLVFKYLSDFNNNNAMVGADWSYIYKIWTMLGADWSNIYEKDYDGRC